MASAAGAQSATPPTTVRPSFVDANGDGVLRQLHRDPAGPGPEGAQGQGRVRSRERHGPAGHGPARRLRLRSWRRRQLQRDRPQGPGPGPPLAAGLADSRLARPRPREPLSEAGGLSWPFHAPAACLLAPPVPRAHRPPGRRLDGGARGVRDGPAGGPRAPVGLAPVPPPPRPRALHRDLRARGRARLPADLRAVDPRGLGVRGDRGPARRPRRFHRRRPSRVPGRATGLERPRRGSHRGEPEGPRDPRSAGRSGAVADPAGRHAPPAAAELALRPHQPRDGHDRRSAPGLRRRHVPRDAAAHGGGGRARRGRLRDGGGGHPGLRAPPGALAPRGRRDRWDGRARGPRSDRPPRPQSRHGG